MTESLSVMLDRMNEVNRQLQRASRHAGMAEVATGVLHNVGNVLNSVNVAIELMHDRTRELPVDRIGRLERVLAAAATGDTIDRDRLALAARYAGAVHEVLVEGRDASLRALGGLRGHLAHIKHVVAMQNAYARPGGVVGAAALDALVDEAIELGGVHEHQGGIALSVAASRHTVSIDRHRVLQVVVNLVANARDAVLAASGARRIAVTAEVTDHTLRIAVADSGVGFAADAHDRIFAAGYTTKPRGHGYGLHSSALMARQLGGALTATSPGPGLGAVFTLTVPTAVEESRDDH